METLAETKTIAETKQRGGGVPVDHPTAAYHPLVIPGPIDGDDPVEHIKYRLANTSKQTWPYPHFFCENVFPAPFYKEMIDRFPADEYLPPLNDIYPKRLSLRIGIPDQIDSLPEADRAFWRALGQRLGSRSFMRHVLRQYDPLMEDRFGEIVEPHIYLHSDVDSYGIGPHVDIHDKVVSMIFYMPDSPRDDMNAASVLIKDAPDLEIRPAYEEKWDGYTAVRTIPFKPNILFTFAVTHESWHGVRPNPAGVPRRSLQYFIKMPYVAKP